MTLILAAALDFARWRRSWGAGPGRTRIRVAPAVEVVDRLPERWRDGLPARATQLGAPAQQLDHRFGAAGPLCVRLRGSHDTRSPRRACVEHP